VSTATEKRVIRRDRTRVTCTCSECCRLRARARGTFTITLALAFASTAHAGPLHDLADRVDHELTAIEAARGPQLTPPTPIAIAWHPQKLAPSLDLDAPLVALAAGDLDGDGRAELYVVTTRDVIAFSINGTRARELGRVAFAGEPAAHRPRDPVGAAFVDGKHLIASASSFAHPLEVSWKGKQLVGELDKSRAPGIALCAGETRELAPGRDYFSDGSYGARCRDDLVAADGHPLHVRGQLAIDGKLRVTVERCELAGTCAKAGEFSYTHVGVGFEFADLDRDGTPEAIFAGAGAPGEPDELRVVAFGDDEHKAKLRKAFSAGGVEAIAVGELERKTPIVIAAVRLEGASRVDLWRMN
jgi:hypothetical protein